LTSLDPEDAMRLVITDDLGKVGGSPGLIILCPWLAGLPEETGLWISALPVHDVNAIAEADEPVAIPPALEHLVYFGVFALDRFRAPGRLLQRLRARGIGRIVNLPSVTFFDGRTAATLRSLDFGLAQEIEFLKRARAEGLRTGLCARTSQLAGLDEADRFDFILSHDGPGSELTLTSALQEFAAVP
jgi:predicted TIM-barrel enzyme